MNRFNDESIILRFGVASDVHVSGSWNQPRSKAKLAHIIDVFEKTAEDCTGSRLDALLINGDLVDSVNSIGNVFKNYGTKLEQNVREITHVSDCIHGEHLGGVGRGIDDGTYFFYSLGNHDESGCGRTGYNPEKAGYPPMHSAAIFAAVFCGWKCRDVNEENTEFKSYIRDLAALYGSATESAKAEFSEKYGVDADSALALFEKYYGRDIDFADDDALLFGNRHTVINGIHFAALETSCCENTVSYFEKICAESVSEDPKKPIFAMTHYRVRNTIFESEDGLDRLRPVLEKYPQVVIWAGHTHTPLFLENAIWRKGFTCIDSSVGAYLSNGSLIGSASETDHPYNLPTKESHNFGNGCYVEVDSEYNVRINRIDLYRSYSADYGKSDIYKGIGIYDDYERLSVLPTVGGEIEKNSPWRIDNPYFRRTSEPTDRAVFIRKPWILSDFDDKNAAVDNNLPTEEPSFADDAEVSVKVLGDGFIDVEFDSAESSDMVFTYTVRFKKLSDGDAEERVHILTTYPHLFTDTDSMPKKQYARFGDFDDGETYLIAITASDILGGESNPVISSFTA